MSWHDNHVHAIRIIEGEYGTGKLVFDLDYILEWKEEAEGKFTFLILPAGLTFHDVTNLRILIDYATPTAALGPFSIHSIERHIEQRERYNAQLWTILINWPSGEITFEAHGYEQRGIAKPSLSDTMYLNADMRISGTV